MIPLLIAGATVAASLASSYFERKAQEEMLSAQASSMNDATAANTAAMQSQYANMQSMLQPHVDAGNQALGQMNALSGASGVDAQRAAIEGIQNSPELQSMIAQGENSMLQNASATGGLRGGNTQAAMAQFAPSMLNQAIQQQYGNLSGLANMGAQVGGQLGAAGMNMQGNLANMNMANAGMQGNLAGFQAQGQAGGGAFGSALTNAFGTGMGTYAGLGGDFGMSNPGGGTKVK